MPDNEGRKIDQIDASLVLPDILVGGNLDDKKFITFSKSTLIAAINTLIAARVNGITLTGLTGSTIEHEAFANRIILSIGIDDVLRNTNFTKPTNTSVNLSDDFELTQGMKVTFNFA